MNRALIKNNQMKTNRTITIKPDTKAEWLITITPHTNQMVATQEYQSVMLLNRKTNKYHLNQNKSKKSMKKCFGPMNTSYLLFSTAVR